jgi:hypothetical protein
MLNERKQALVDLLERYTILGLKLSRSEIQANLPMYYTRTSDNDYYDGALHQITKDIHEINADTTTDALILSTPQGIWLAGEHEVYIRLQAERTAIIKRFVLLQQKLKKARNNKQLTFNFDDFNIFTKETLQ